MSSALLAATVFNDLTTVHPTQNYQRQAAFNEQLISSVLTPIQPHQNESFHQLLNGIIGVASNPISQFNNTGTDINRAIPFGAHGVTG